MTAGQVTAADDSSCPSLRNQYAASQCPNGGYGWRNVGGDAAGPVATVDSTGTPGLLESPDGGYLSAALPGLDLSTAQIAAALDTARPVILQPWPAVKTRRRVAFMHDLLIVPAESLPAKAIVGFTERARQTAASLAGPVFGDRLETQPDLWGRAEGWRFPTNGLHVTSGDIGLLECGGLCRLPLRVRPGAAAGGPGHHRLGRAGGQRQ